MRQVRVCELPGTSELIRYRGFDPGDIITLDAAFGAHQKWRVVTHGTYWTALAVPLEDPCEVRNGAIWQAVRDVAGTGYGVTE